MLSDPDPWTKWAAIGSVASALATFFGVLFAAVAGIVALRLYKMESARDRKADEREERADAYARRQQASQVGFWYAGDGVWMLVNHSPLPIYDVYVGTIKVTYQGFEKLRTIVDFQTAAALGTFQGFLGPGHEQAFLIETDGAPQLRTIGRYVVVNDDQRAHQDLASCVFFVDNAGTYWFREAFELREFDDLSPETMEAVHLASLVTHSHRQATLREETA